jgi:phosphoribosylpyrophosphate synthetase
MRVAERVFNKSISPIDVRDYKIAVTTQDFPKTFSLPTVTIKNQGSIGSCVAHACSSLVEYHNKRQENTVGLFDIRYPEEWKDKHILLVDDVITSGSTLLACMQTLIPIKGCRVSVFALGWAHH